MGTFNGHSRQENMFKVVLIVLQLIILVQQSYGQSIYRADREEYIENKFINEVWIQNDSTCFLTGYNKNYSTYFLYKGKINMINDTLFVLIYRPVVKFGCNKRLNVGFDSVRFHLQGVDTTVLPLVLNLKSTDNRTIEFTKQKTIIDLKGSSENEFIIDTKFIDPLSKKNISMVVNKRSEPDLTYFGSGTPEKELKISLVDNLLTLFPDYIHIWDQETFIKNP